MTIRLREQIKQFGPISFRDWMAAALYDPEFGYYQRTDLSRWGRTGDYRTAPETSVLFGATFARYFAECYRELGEPEEWTIFEAGAGAGDFAHDCLSFLSRVHPTIYRSTNYLIDEISAAARGRSVERLGAFGEVVSFGGLSEIPSESLTGIIFANELLDAFPVTRVTVLDGKLCEIGVGLDRDDSFCWQVQPEADARAVKYLERTGIALAEGQIADLNFEAPRWWGRAAAALKRGYVIAVDYGCEAAELFAADLRPQGSLRAIANHQLQPDPLSSPGRFDLTANVDWTTVRLSGESAGLETVYYGSLDKFLVDAGALEVLTEIEAGRPESVRAQLRLSLRELVLPAGLGNNFRVLVQRKHG